MDPLNFYHVAIRSIIVRVMYPEIANHAETLYAPYLHFAHYTSYQDKYAPVVCRWLHAAQRSIPTEVTAELFYYWARFMFRSPCELQEHPVCLLQLKTNQVDDWLKRREEVVQTLVRLDEKFNNQEIASFILSNYYLRQHNAELRLQPLPESKWEQQPDELSEVVVKYLEKEKSAFHPDDIQFARLRVLQKYKQQGRTWKHKFVWNTTNTTSYTEEEDDAFSGDDEEEFVDCLSSSVFLG